MFDSFAPNGEAWCYIAADTLSRWYRERQLERFDQLTQRCLRELARPLPPFLWRTIAALNHRLGDREEAVTEALTHDGGSRTYRDHFTLGAMARLADERIARGQPFLSVFE